MVIRRAIRNLFGLDRLGLRDLAILIFTIVFLGFLVVFGIMKIMESMEKYNTGYYDPSDYQREELIKKELDKKE